MTDRIFVLLGSNEGNRLENLENACQKINLFCGIIREKSSIYETAAWGKTNQSSFLNLVIEIKSDLSAPNLLENLLEIEKSLGRQRVEKWGARTIDLDILFFGCQIINTEHLQVPHPAIQQRRFTLVPLAEIAPNFIHPVLQKTCLQILDECPDELAVIKFL
jgi:2-amino-4-hydroxy-6-hydroxymethyldihydropteridine diphosphokinase